MLGLQAKIKEQNTKNKTLQENVNIFTITTRGTYVSYIFSETITYHFIW